jgi:hypothetical protein
MSLDWLKKPLSEFRKPNHQILLGVIFAASVIVPLQQASAEIAEATTMWGTGNVASGGAVGQTSAGLHVSMGISAGQENAARKRLLYSGPNMTVVGSQTIVQVTGNNNVVKDIDQNAINSGNQSLDAPIE